MYLLMFAAVELIVIALLLWRAAIRRRRRGIPHRIVLRLAAPVPQYRPLGSGRTEARWFLGCRWR